MYILARMVDTVRIPPHSFRIDNQIEEQLKWALNKKFSNKVVMNVGLGVCFYNFDHIGDSIILPGDGASHTKVTFGFVMFRPFMDEILVGRIRSGTREGLHLSLDFFEDVFVPRDKLRPNTTFREDEQVWVWEYEQEEGQPAAELFMEKGATVRFRVVGESFTDTQPGKPPGPVPLDSADDAPDPTDAKTPYSIIGSMVEDGLGCVAWWTPSEEEPEEEESQPIES